MLGVGESTLEKWRFEGRGPRFVKLGRCVRYAAEEIAEWIALNTREITGPPAT